MGRNTSFSLGEHFDGYTAGQVAEGRYVNASDVVRAGLQLLETQELQLAVLRAALIEGEDSGSSEPFDFDEFIAKARAGEPPT